MKIYIPRVVVHETFGQGTCVPTMFSDPDENGVIHSVDVMFEDDIVQDVNIDDLEVLDSDEIDVDDAEFLDELSKKTLGQYIKTASNTMRASEGERARATASLNTTDNAKRREARSSLIKSDKDIGKRWKGITRAVDRLTKEEVENLDEKRGRPAKEGSAAWKRQQVEKSAGNHEDEEDTHPVMQHRKNKSMQGQHKIKFGNGESHSVSHADSVKALHNHSKIAKPNDKSEYEKRLHASHDSFKKAISEEVDQIDEVSAGKLGNYIRKASDDKFKNMNNIPYEEPHRGDTGPNWDSKEGKQVHKRHAGIELAKKKLTSDKDKMYSSVKKPATEETETPNSIFAPDARNAEVENAVLEILGQHNDLLKKHQEEVFKRGITNLGQAT